MNILMWIAESSNHKTGPIPQCWVGRSIGETLRSCKMSGCKLWDKAWCKEHDTLPCYFWSGTPLLAKCAMDLALAEGRKTYTLEEALEGRRACARHVRLGAGGDHIAVVEETIAAAERCLEVGLEPLGFTHAWRKPKAKSLRGWLMASCDTLADVDVALDLGWRPAVILPKAFGIAPHSRRVGWSGARSATTPGGATVHVCSAQIDKAMDCNTCGRCNARKPGPPVAFVQHR